MSEVKTLKKKLFRVSTNKWQNFFVIANDSNEAELKVIDHLHNVKQQKGDKDSVLTYDNSLKSSDDEERIKEMQVIFETVIY